jgi:stage II sporulation protein D
VLRRGRSPRIVRARVYGSRGSRVLTGAQIRARLDLYDSWAYFTKVSTAQVKRAAGPRPQARRARALVSAFREIAGVFDPAPRARRLLVERRRGGRWRQVGAVATTARGRYRSPIAVAGVYRVRAGGIAGPAVRVRR